MRKLLTVALLLFSLSFLKAQFNLNYTNFDTVAPKIGNSVVVKGLLWEHFDRRPMVMSYYDSVAKFINIYKNVIFQIESHNDCRASAEYNLALTQRRADMAREELLKLLNDTTQLPIAIGKGEDEPALPKCKCDMTDKEKICTEEEHQQNRRTLLQIIEIRDTSDPKGIMTK